ncbi:hypothetical protein [Reinekea forsetii]|uniref:Uncharacterized protein n=1 Tax=Reinekea forsetii TaxID=1336806 RepID=A0A2K8KSU5_9GAMM|nr:hypothetical protein [Reinekea forsetii]ATX77149.1 hypothetical protein REIFOR_02014 [Reinekea forsetii]MDO7643282.1 hypothetical protein [Reinekea forsetii]
MANDGIRLPSDSTVTSQKIIRGGGEPETTALPSKNLPLTPMSPLVTVVLQSKTLLAGNKASLFELILQNDPKSAPPLSVFSDAPIRPGTSLLLEFDKHQQYQPVRQPTQAQLTKLVNLELDFWRGHLLPKADARNFPTLPSPVELTGLAHRFSALSPLVHWLNQRPTSLSSPVVAAWIRETVALSQLRYWSSMPKGRASGLAALGSGMSLLEGLDSIDAAPPSSGHANLPSPAGVNPKMADSGLQAPLEIKLGQWLGLMDDTIKAAPDQLNSRLKQQAAALIAQSLQQANKIRAQNPLEASQNANSSKDDSPLLALRNWLEASQARIQNSAILGASAQWSAPDQPTVQQMQLPLIWLGLTSWADIEWWQEQHRNTANADKDARARRRWRMKVYLSLAPMADICADIDWGGDATQLTFWSEDAATLSHLNTLLPKLESWTAGLGERNITTKHGMPKKMNADRQKEKDNHLVDIHT